MRQKHWIIAVVALIMVAVAVWYLTRPPRSDAPIVIGAVFPLTGPAAQYGGYMREGTELALDDAISQGLVKPSQVRLVFEDGAADPAKSVTAFRKLVDVDHPVAVALATSGVILAIKPIANQSHVVILNGSAISPEIEDADDYSFSFLPDARVEGAFLADFAVKSGRKQIGIIYRNDASGIAFRDAFKARLQSLGASLVYEDAHRPGENDFRPYLPKIAGRQDLDALFIASFGPEAAAFVKQAREQGVTTQLLAYTTFYSPKVLELAGPAANGVVFSAPAFDPASSQPSVDELRGKIERKYGHREVNYYHAVHYDATMIVLRAVASGARDGEAVRSHLAKLKAYDGKSGHITFGPNGSADVPLHMYTVTNGKFVPLTTPPGQPASTRSR
jgi:branched-chain amino acid transport system substrate-binding protein